MNTTNTIIIKIESGVVADIFSIDPLQVIVVDYDMIEGGETLECRMKKSVISVTPEHGINAGELDEMVKKLVLECRRPADRRSPLRIPERVEAAA